MKQILQSYRDGELWVADVPAPAVREGMVVIRTVASVVSAGTERMLIELAGKSLVGKAMARPDLVKKVLRKIRTEGFFQTMEKVNARLDNPVALGYSCAGVVLETGARVKDLRVGDRVACAGAGYATHAEFNIVPEQLCVRIPVNLAMENAAFASIGAIALQGVRQSEARIGETVAVIGLGLVGLLTVQILRAAGCRVVGTDPDEHGCALAGEFGAETAAAGDIISRTNSITGGHGADAVIITAGTKSNEPVELAAELCRQKGRVVVVGMVGMDLPRDSFYRKELDLRLSMSCGPGRYDSIYEEQGCDYPYGYVRWTEQRNMQAFLELAAAGRIQPARLVTHRFSLEDALNGYSLFESKTGTRPMGIVLTYGADEPVEISCDRRETAQTSRKQVVAAPVEGILNVALIGAGNFAKSVLMPVIRKARDVRISHLCSMTGSGVSARSGDTAFDVVTTRPEEIFQDKKVQAVIVATRHNSHAKLIVEAIKAGKHVFCEKPLAMNVGELGIVASAVSEASAGQVLQVGYNRRFSPHSLAVKDAFSARTEPMMIQYSIFTGRVPRDSWIRGPEGGGRIIGEVCHFTDLCRFIAGSHVEQVFAVAAAPAGSGSAVDDCLQISMSFADGSVAGIAYTSIASADLPKERIVVSCGGGTAVVDDFCTTTFYSMQSRNRKGVQSKGFAEEMDAFFAAARKSQGSPISFKDLEESSRIIFAVEESLRKGQPVRL